MLLHFIQLALGATTSWDILNEVRAIRNHMGQDVSIYTFGFGDDLDSNLLWVSNV